MLDRPFGVILLSTALLVVGLAGIVAFWGAWPRTVNTSPLMALFALSSSAIYMTAGVLTWRGSRLAGPVFVAAIALLLLPARYIVPGGQLFVPSLIFVVLLAFVGYRFLARRRELAG